MKEMKQWVLRRMYVKFLPLVNGVSVKPLLHQCILF